MNWELVNGTLITPGKIIPRGSLSVENNRINKIGKSGSFNQKNLQIDINGLYVFPGLIDSHDHLLEHISARRRQKPYLNWLMWDNDLKSSPIYAERQQIESADLYLLGGFRHLLCGVTSVQDHIPHFVQDAFKANLPIRIVDKFTMAHSIGSFALKWGTASRKSMNWRREADPFCDPLLRRL